MPPKKVAVLKDEFIPSPIKELLQLFDLIDSLYIFLNRRHMPCTLKSMKALIKTMNISEPISLDLNNIFILTQIHGDGMLLAINLSSDPSLLSTQETISELVEVTFTEISGVSPTQQAKRRQSFRKSLSHYIYAQVADCFEDFLVKSQESSPKKKSSKKNDPVKEAWETVCESNIWPNNINTSSFKLPQAQLDYHPTLRECPVLVNYIAKEASLRSVATTLQSTHINLSTNDPSLDSCITEEHISVNPTSSEIINNRDDLLKQHEGKINRAIHTLLNSPIYKGQIVHMKITDAQPAVYANLHRPLTSANLQMTLEQVLGIKKFYRHQAAAIDAVRSGKHVVLSTSTASGKSLVFNVPVIESILERPETRALYLFPTKALAQDQLRALNQIILNPSFPLSVTSGICDGDVGFADRVKIRESCQMVISNPDMLHYTLLPQHITWKHFFANLRYVVIDEAHEYKGAFGAHVSCVLRRLLRVCLHYGSVPLFVVCSATIGNPLQHFMNLAPLKALYSTSTGDSDDVDKWKDRVCVVDQSQDGSPCGQQTFVIWNPPVKRLSSLAVLTSEKALVSSGKIAEVKIPTDDNMSIENTENDTCNGDNSTNKAVDTSGQQTVDISVGFEEVVSYGYEYDYGGAESGHDQHPFPTFLRGCEDRPTTFGMPVNPHTHVRYTGGWGRKRKLKPIKDEQGEEEVPPEKEVDRKVIHPVGHKKVNNKYKQRNQLNVQSNDQEYVDTMERYSSIIEASLIFSRLIESHCRTLVFCKSRKLVELVLKYSLQEVRRLDDSGQLAQRVASYRGGYTKEERRAIEKDLFRYILLLLL